MTRVGACVGLMGFCQMSNSFHFFAQHALYPRRREPNLSFTDPPQLTQSRHSLIPNLHFSA